MKKAMKKRARPNYIPRGEGVFLEDLAVRLGVHRNTIVNWSRMLRCRRGLMMGEQRVRRQAMRTADVLRFEEKARKAGLIPAES